MPSAKDVFHEWGKSERADRMADQHWPRVAQVLERILPSTGSCLEIGSGNGRVLEFLAGGPFAEGSCVGIEISPSMAERCLQRLSPQSHVRVLQGDFMELDLKTYAPFDFIFSMEVFYYFQDMQLAVQCCAELLSPGGKLVVMVDFYRENPESHSWPTDLGVPMQLWSKAQYRDAFTKAGLVELSQVQLGDTKKDAEPERFTTLCTFGVKH